MLNTKRWVSLSVAAPFLPEETSQNLPHSPDASLFRIRHHGDQAAVFLVFMEDTLMAFPSKEL